MQEYNFNPPFYFTEFTIVKNDNGQFKFEKLFDNNQGSLKKRLEEQGSTIRGYGWGIPDHINFNILMDSIEYKDSVRRIKIFENGRILIQSAVNESFLCWANNNKSGTQKGDRIEINAISLIEFTYSSIQFLNNAILFNSNMENLKIKVQFGFKGLDHNFTLASGHPNSPFSDYGNLKVEDALITQNLFAEYNPDSIKEELTLNIIKVVYRFFGFGEDVIPFVKDNKINVEDIIKR